MGMIYLSSTAISHKFPHSLFLPLTSFWFLNTGLGASCPPPRSQIPRLYLLRWNLAGFTIHLLPPTNPGLNICLSVLAPSCNSHKLPMLLSQLFFQQLIVLYSHGQRITWNAQRCTVSLLLSLHPLTAILNIWEGPPRSTYIAKLRLGATLPSQCTVFWHCFLVAEKSAQIFIFTMLSSSFLCLVNWSAVEYWHWPGILTMTGTWQNWCTAWRSLAAFWQIFCLWAFHVILLPCVQ
jgi:hypothetical protein